MKKLMIAAAIVCAAAMSQAAAISWSVKGDGMGNAAADDVVAQGTAVYLINATTDQDALVKALTGAAYESTVSAAQIALGAVKTDGKISQPSGTTTLAGGLSGVQAYYVLFDGDKMFVSDAQAVGWMTSGDGYYSVDFKASNADEASWMGEPSFNAAEGFQGAGWYQAAAVPEPTSGLLLLLGVAGLALRRRRA